jgi:ABC-type proline/glycine betaine transport system ATPase subunit
LRQGLLGHRDDIVDHDQGDASDHLPRRGRDLVPEPADIREELQGREIDGLAFFRQREAAAAALAEQLIICDEVTSALDQLVAEEILKLLLRLQKELNVSYLYITHDLATVKAIADEIVVMYQGRVVESGAKSQVLTPPHHEYTELLLSSVPEMDPDWLDGILNKRESASISA